MTVIPARAPWYRRIGVAWNVLAACLFLFVAGIVLGSVGFHELDTENARLTAQNRALVSEYRQAHAEAATARQEAAEAKSHAADLATDIQNDRLAVKAYLAGSLPVSSLLATLNEEK